MKLNKQLIASFLFLLFMLSCEDDKDPKISVNYITEYVGNAERIDLNVVANENALLMIVDGDREKQGEASFNVIARQVSDTSFNQPENKCFEVPCIAETFESINIISNKDYDSDHPAGSLLNDIVEISYLLPLRVVSANYDLSVNKQVNEMLNDFNVVSHNFTSYTFQLHFISLPINKEKHSFTVKYKKADGNVLEETIENVNFGIYAKNGW